MDRLFEFEILRSGQVKCCSTLYPSFWPSPMHLSLNGNNTVTPNHVSNYSPPR